MNCMRCGNKLDEGAAFCGNCGAPVVSAQPSVPSSPAVVVQQYPGAQPAYIHPAPAAKNNGLPLAALITGIIAFMTAIILVGGLIGIAAIILGIFGLKHPNEKGLSIAGIVLGALAVLGVAAIFAIASFVSQ